jgi:Secretion system C-terminal sorting domain
MRSLFILVLFLFLPHYATAQLVLTRSLADDLVGKIFDGTAFVNTSPSAAAALVDRVGENQTWDISGLTFEVDDTFSFELTDNLAGLPRSASFPTANIAVIVRSVSDPNAAVFEFSEVTETHLLSHGLVSVEDDPMTQIADTSLTTFEPPFIDMVWPLSFGTTWKDSAYTVTDGVGSFSSVGEHSVDGWGTLVTPSGSREVLRITSMEVETIPTVYSDTSYTVRFLAATGEIAEFHLDGDMNLEEVNYETLEERTGTGVAVELPTKASLVLEPAFPNPFVDKTSMRFIVAQTQATRVAVFDVLGREVEVLYDGVAPGHTHIDLSVDSHSLPAGIYVVRLESGSSMVTRLITRTR